jgi:hypothetical protein
MAAFDAPAVVIGRSLATAPRHDQTQEIRIRQESPGMPWRDRCHVLCHAKLSWLAEQVEADRFGRAASTGSTPGWPTLAREPFRAAGHPGLRVVIHEEQIPRFAANYQEPSGRHAESRRRSGAQRVSDVRHPLGRRRRSASLVD